MLGRPSALRLIFGIVGLSFVGFVLVMGMPVRAQGPDNGKGPHPARLEGVPILTIGNDLIEADLDSFGGFIIGTRAGDPNNNDDDHKDLLYGFFIKDIFSSYASLHVVGGPKEGIYKLQSNAPAQPPVLVNGDSAFTFWTLNGVRVEQTLTPAFNPFTNRDDTVRIQYRLTNVYTATLQAGIRSMLDVQIGMNDGAPYLVPNVGQVTREREYDRAHMPPFWKAFESAQFDPGSVKGLGILSGFGATTPDRFVIARWGRPSEQNGIGLYPASWTYDVDSSATIQQDSAVAMYWNPQTLAPGQSVTYVTYYGLAGPGGGSAFIEAPGSVTCQNLDFVATLFVNNLTDNAFQGGQATINLPAGLVLANGESLTKGLPDVAPGNTESLTWRLRAGRSQSGTLNYSVNVTFSQGASQLTATARVQVPACAAETATPTLTSTSTATRTPSATPARTATATPTATPRQTATATVAPVQSSIFLPLALNNLPYCGLDTPIVGNTLRLRYGGKVTAHVISTDAACTASFGIASPDNSQIFADYAVIGEQATVGTYPAGTELVFYITMNPGCGDQTYYSTDPDHAVIRQICYNRWQLFWDDSYVDRDFNDSVIEIEAVP